MVGNLCLDLVVISLKVERRIHIVDVVIPFENRYEARRLKIEKYTPIAEGLLQGFYVTLNALSIGA